MNIPKPVEMAPSHHPYPLIFATISGAHLYGFPSPDSDYDLRGVHVLPTDSVIGLETPDETIEVSSVEDGVELDLVTHDIKKFIKLMLKPNGYVLEQLFSPLIVQTSKEHDELKELGMRCITRHHSHHYLGFSQSQWKLFESESPARVKPLLYVYRVLLTGINLMHTGRIEPNLTVLNETFKLPYIPDLIRKKTTSGEQQSLSDVDLNFHRSEFTRLRQELESAAAATKLPEATDSREELNDLLKRVRLNTRA